MEYNWWYMDVVIYSFFYFYNPWLKYHSFVSFICVRYRDVARGMDLVCFSSVVTLIVRVSRQLVKVQQRFRVELETRHVASLALDPSAAIDAQMSGSSRCYPPNHLHATHDVESS